LAQNEDMERHVYPQTLVSVKESSCVMEWFMHLCMIRYTCWVRVSSQWSLWKAIYTGYYIWYVCN